MPDVSFEQGESGNHKSRHQHRSHDRCPKCSGELIRVRRRVVDRLLSVAVPVYRFRCNVPFCGNEVIRRTNPGAARPYVLALVVAGVAGAILLVGDPHLTSEVRSHRPPSTHAVFMTTVKAPRMVWYVPMRHPQTLRSTIPSRSRMARPRLETAYLGTPVNVCYEALHCASGTNAQLSFALRIGGRCRLILLTV
jgi:hypothetical protein